MARYTKMQEGSSGKIGSIVTYQMYGKSYMGSLPSHYKDQKSEKQLVQRQKMQLINKFLSPIKDILRFTFRKEALGRSAYMAAKSYNIRLAISGEYPEQHIDYTKALVSKGDVLLPTDAQAKQTDKGLLFEWKYNIENIP